VNNWLEIQRSTGVDKRAVRSERGSPVGTADGACPGCGTEPFLVQGDGLRRHTHDTYRANGRSKCCGDAVGYLFAKTDTLFGLEEDDAVLRHGRARVYW
jgi:hypothetical protein